MNQNGEVPRAYIAIKECSTLSERSIHDHMRKCLAGFKQLTGGIVFVPCIPRLMVGKLLKRLLREQAKYERDSVMRARQWRGLLRVKRLLTIFTVNMNKKQKRKENVRFCIYPELSQQS